MQHPEISIIIPCFNQAEYLDECLSSVFNQTLEDWECVIINDGSTDQTESIAEEWVKRDIRFRYLYQENSGVSNARNSGIMIAKGRLILPLDADDKISSQYTYLGLEVFRNNSDVMLVYGYANKIGDVCEKWNLKPFTLRNLAVDNVIYCSAIYKKSDWELVGGYDENMKKGLEDWEFWIGLLKNGGNVICITETVFFYRVKKKSRQMDLTRENKEELFDYLSIKHSDFFVTQLGSFQKLHRQIRDLKHLNNKNRYFKRNIINNFCEAFFGFSILKTVKRFE